MTPTRKNAASRRKQVGMNVLAGILTPPPPPSPPSPSFYVRASNPSFPIPSNLTFPPSSWLKYLILILMASVSPGRDLFSAGLFPASEGASANSPHHAGTLASLAPWYAVSSD